MEIWNFPRSSESQSYFEAIEVIWRVLVYNLKNILLNYFKLIRMPPLQGIIVKNVFKNISGGKYLQATSQVF